MYGHTLVSRGGLAKCEVENISGGAKGGKGRKPGWGCGMSQEAAAAAWLGSCRRALGILGKASWAAVPTGGPGKPPWQRLQTAQISLFWAPRAAAGASQPLMSSGAP